MKNFSFESPAFQPQKSDIKIEWNRASNRKLPSSFIAPLERFHKTEHQLKQLKAQIKLIEHFSLSLKCRLLIDLSAVNICSILSPIQSVFNPVD